MAFKVGVIQLKVGRDKTENLARMRVKVIEACKNGAQMIVLPEFFNTPYGMDFVEEYAEAIPDGPSTQALASVAKECNCFIIGGSIPEFFNENYYNTCLVFDEEGNLVDIHRKAHLFDIDISGKIFFQESEKLSRGDKITVVDSKFGLIGIGICYDLRFNDYAAACARLGGAKLLVFPGALNTTTGPLHWELLLRARAVDEQVWTIGCSSARNDEGYAAYGHSMVVDPWGRVIAEAPESEQIVYADIVITFDWNMLRARSPSQDSHSPIPLRRSPSVENLQELNLIERFRLFLESRIRDNIQENSSITPQ